MDRQQDYRASIGRWLALAVGGLVLIGAGISVVGEAISRRIAAEAWFWIGTGGLVLLNSGISMVAQAAMERVLMLQSRD